MMKGNQGLDALAAMAHKARSENSGGSNAPPQNANGGTITSTASKAEAPAAVAPIQLNASVLPAPPGLPANVNPQQWQQALATAYGNATTNPAVAATMLQAAAGNLPQADQAAAMQRQIAYYQYMQLVQAAALQAQVGAAQQQQAQVQPQQVHQLAEAAKTAGAFVFPAQPTQILPQTGAAAALKQQGSPQQQPSQPQAKPVSVPSQAQPAANNSMQPPPPPSQASTTQNTLSTNGLVMAPPAARSSSTSAAAAKIVLLGKPQQTAIAQRPPETSSSSASPNAAAAAQPFDDKKSLKRAANRRSAQLSRKRKKAFIEELKEENDELRRKEQILKSIPDLIVVFDSAGKLWFVSHSVSRFVDFTPKELEGSSFWERLCDESVRLLKAAFMDALAARKSGSDTAPLGSGVWELRLVDKDGTHKVITLNGVVHFSGETPECVCSIRPREEAAADKQRMAATQRNVSVSSSSDSSLFSSIKPHQSVISSSESERIKVRARRAAQISDGDSGSIISESGSDEI